MARSKHRRKSKSRNRPHLNYTGETFQGERFGPDFTKLSKIEIHDDQPGDLHPEVESRLRASLAYLRHGHGSKAEQVLREAIEIDPNNPALLNNLAKALGLQAKRAEAEALTFEIQRRFPKYAFGHINAALILIEKNEYDRAREILNSLLDRKRLHFAEFSAMAAAQIKLALALGHRDKAEHWLELMKQVDPEDPNLKPLQALVRPSLFNLFHRLRSIG
jgi:tetratricopeptide (TPR) repeat protein